MLTPGISVIGSAIGIYLKSRQQNPSWPVVFSFFGALTFCALATSYYTHIKPLRDPAANGRLLLDTIGHRIIEYGKEKNLPLRLNMLLIYRPARHLFFKRFLRIRWNLEMKFAPDGTADFDVNKGVAGAAIASGWPKLVNMEVNKDNWGFSEKEMAMFPKFTMIWSFPMFELDKNGDPTGTRLGAVNLDSTTIGAANTMLSDHEFEELMEEFRDIASRLASC